MTRNQFISSLPKNLFAGFVVSLIALPLGLSLAVASGMPATAGIVSAVVGGVVVALLGGSYVTISGPGYSLVVVLLTAVTTLGGGDLFLGYTHTLAAITLASRLYGADMCYNRFLLANCSYLFLNYFDLLL